MAKPPSDKSVGSHRAARLRQQAEEFLRTSPRDIEAMSAEGIQVLVHELQVYQVELEMQNEELHRVQHELEESRRLYQDLFDLAPVGYLSVDHAGRIVQANLTVASVLGVDRVQLEGALLAHFVVFEDRDVLHQHLQAVKNSASHICELRIQHQQGKHHDVRLETRAVRDETSDTSVYRMALLVITERKRAEKRFEKLLEATPDAMIVLDGQDGITLVNTQMEQVFGYTRQELLGQPVEMLIPQRFQRKHVTHRDAYFAAPTVRPMGVGLALYGQRKNGTEFPIEVSLSPLETDDGLLVLAAIRDVSARQQMQDKLQQSEQRFRELAGEQEQLLIASDRLVSLGELAASLTHEFNNPLGIVMGFAQDLLSEAEPSSPYYQRLQIIESQARRCSQLLKDLTDLARPLHTHRVPTDVVELVHRSLDLAAGRLRQNTIETQLDLPNQLGPVAVDPQQLEQVLLNIYFNAIEAMPEGGTLTVRVDKHQQLALPDGQEEPSEVQIAVIDTGIGIAADHRPQIFRPFFTTKQQRGMGLGLSICEAIMRAHGGRISIDSTPGQGTTVLLQLPLEVPGVEYSDDSDS